MSKVQYKLCKGCKQEFPRNADYFFCDKSTLDGLEYKCKSCRQQARGMKTRRIITICESGLRECRTCKQIFPETSEYFATGKKNKLGLRHECRECKRIRDLNSSRKPEIAASRKLKNKIKFSDPVERNKKRESDKRSKAKNPQRTKIQKHESYERNKHKHIEQQHNYYLDNKDKVKTRARNWKAANPEKVNISVHKRLAKKRHLPATLTTSEWHECLDYWDNQCAICGRKPDKQYLLAKEHWIPLADERPNNPGTVAHNIIPVCHGRRKAHVSGCNENKWKHDPEIWIRKTYSPDEAETILKRIYEYLDSKKSG